MRNEDAIALALMVLSAGGVDVSDALRDTLMGTWKKTRAVDLRRVVPLMIVYRVAEVRGSELALYPDVYRRERGQMYARATEALFAAHYDTSLVNHEVLRRSARTAATRAITVPLNVLLISPVGLESNVGHTTFLLTHPQRSPDRRAPPFHRHCDDGSRSCGTGESPRSSHGGVTCCSA